MENELKRASITKQLTKIILVLGFLLVSLWSFASNSAYAQEKKFTFEFNKTSIKEILGYIENIVNLYLCIAMIYLILPEKFQ